eukprot:5904416-Pleurochrysis_carterae.AAC.2
MSSLDLLVSVSRLGGYCIAAPSTLRTSENYEQRLKCSTRVLLCTCGFMVVPSVVGGDSDVMAAAAGSQ